MTKSKILIVEDDAILAKVIYEELSEADFEVFQAYDGEEGLKMANEKHPDLILLDILLPKKNGFEVLEILKRTPETKMIPVTLLTMLGSDDEIKKGFELGAGDYIVKSQHALPEIIEKVRGYFSQESHPQGDQAVVGESDIPQPNIP